MALEGLFPVKDEGRLISQNPDIIYPKLGSMLEYILKQQPKFVDSTEMREQKLLFPSNMYVAMIKFLLKCFELELEQNKDLEKSLEFVSSVETLCLLLEHAMATEGSVELHATASKTLITIASHLPEVGFCRPCMLGYFLHSPFLAGLFLRDRFLFIVDDCITLFPKSYLVKAITESYGLGYT